jgi:anti-anti-sigma factor
MSLQMELVANGRVQVIRCTGRITAGEEVKALLERFEEVRGFTSFVLNLAGVNYIDSSGLGALARILVRVRMGHGDLKLCEVPKVVRSVLEVTQMHRQFQIHDSEAAALAAFGTRGESAPDATAAGVQVLCLHESLDMLAFLRTLLNSSGYYAVTTNSPADADVFLKTGKTKLVLLSDKLATLHGSSMVTRFKGIAPAVPVHVLTAEFCAQEPATAGPALLEQIRGMIS